jgi:hypothetical protein
MEKHRIVECVSCHRATVQPHRAALLFTYAYTRPGHDPYDNSRAIVISIPGQLALSLSVRCFCFGFAHPRSSPHSRCFFLCHRFFSLASVVVRNRSLTGSTSGFEVPWDGERAREMKCSPRGSTKCAELATNGCNEGGEGGEK